MALLTLARDAVPAWAKIDLHLHKPIRGWFGLGRLRCEWCSEAWGSHGCRIREFAARLFVRNSTAAQRTAAIDSGELTFDDLRLSRNAPPRHRRKPSPHPRPDTSPGLFAALGITELAAALR